jgi:hypothetical protein
MSNLNEIESLIKDCTGEFVQQPDFAVFLNVCDVLNANPLKVKPILKPLVKRLEKKEANTVHLALLLLEVVVKNCECSHLYVGSADVQSVLLKLATNKKLELRSHEKVLQLVSTWNEAFKAYDRERYLFWKTYAATLKKGVHFPPPELDSPVFTPPEKRVGGGSVAPSVPLAGAAAVANRRHHDIIPQEVVLSSSAVVDDAAVVDSARETASLLRQLMHNDGDVQVARDLYNRLRLTQSEQLPAVVARALDAPKPPTHDDDDGEQGSLIAKALALTDEIDSLLREFRKWQAKEQQDQPRQQQHQHQQPEHRRYQVSDSSSDTPPRSPPETPPRDQDHDDDGGDDPDRYADDFDNFFKHREQGQQSKQSPKPSAPLIDLDDI